MNEYGYKKINNKDKKPLFVVEIRHQYEAVFAVFATAERAKAYLKKEVEDLGKYAPLSFNKSFVFCPALIEAYREADYIRFFEDIATGKLYIDEAPQFLKPGMLTTIKNKDGEQLYYIGKDPEFIDCVTLATDPKNRNTRHRWSRAAVIKAGYIFK